MRRAFLLAALVGAASCRREQPPAPPPPPANLRATLLAVEGDVRLQRASATVEEPAKAGTALAVSDRLQTGAGGHATLLFDDGSTAVVTPRSLVSIEPPSAAGGRGALQVTRGRVDLDIVPSTGEQFRVHTPEAEAGVPAREIMVVGRSGVKGGAR